MGAAGLLAPRREQRGLFRHAAVLGAWVRVATTKGGTSSFSPIYACVPQEDKLLAVSSVSSSTLRRCKARGRGIAAGPGRSPSQHTEPAPGEPSSGF